MENILYHKWAPKIAINCLCRASNSRSHTTESLDHSTALQTLAMKFLRCSKVILTISPLQ